jgi:hypothetical protein
VQFLGHVPVVDVERCDPGFERAEHRLQILIAVVQVNGEVVLAAFMTLQESAVGVDAETARDEMIGESARPIGDLRPRQPAIAEHQALLARTGCGDRLMHFGNGELHVGKLGKRWPRMLTGGGHYGARP